MDGLYEQLRIALHQVWRRRWLAIAVAWAVCLAGWLALAFVPNSYESRARIFVETQSILPTQVGISAAERQNDLMRIKQTLTSNENLERVIRRTELNALVGDERDLAAEVARLRERIEIVAQPNLAGGFTADGDGPVEIVATSNVASFSNAQNARTATATVQALLDLFVEANLAGGRQETGQSLTFLDEQLRRRERDLQEAEQRRVEFEQRFMGLLPGAGSIAQRMSAARAELANIDQQVIAAQSALSAMRTQLAAMPATLPMPGAAGAGGPASAQIAQLESQISQNLGRGWTEQHPDMIVTRQQIERLRPQAEAERRAGGGEGIPNPNYVSVRAMMAEREAQLAAAMARRDQIQSDLAQLGSRQSSEPGLAAEQARLNRDYDVLKQQYDRLLENREQVRLRGDVQTSTNAMNVEVVEPPTRPTAPVAPDRPLFLTFILVAALAAGAGAAFAAGQLQTTFPTRDRLAALTGLPVLGTIGEVVSASERVRRRRQLVRLGATGAALAAGWAVLMGIEFWQRSTVA